MFTGIIETLAEVVATQKDGGNLVITMRSPLASELKIDQSVAHNGVCLTVTNIQDDTFQTVAIAETLQKTNLGQLIPTHYVNIERAMVFNGRIDGHLVQGHVDGVGECLSVTEQDGSWVYRFRFPEEFAALVVEKGSICLNGISLTIFDVTKQEFSVAIIPYTYEHTNMPQVVPGSLVNLEFDILGKYVARQLAVRS
ncbi:riboflavin synthase alpha chain [Chitinophaga terrae (ex Kim and Jung 2007)]|jgi:riboflavin synthase|uniref:Riboflavin synthase n=1 Tax=Chitinophaga terrae (ex Kim and Jung 2007) TaxID=408074 RepID=A0A1H4A5R0_9BACT|nr:riboflavin synthase [Chitinophaga terrae (ex Kim and Jung 2007)]MDQ0106014.1 riboflavin synthase [Chitinophaga terrae (ex Kim and Jung 2007)]GEP90061.1 riboflavin synthase subunit alpha [Chitinophaga terrae (ex Kim and Jung 2007)]SEA31305.1 riboflavin synthase alpha chain [Chitinophaga terrae (ex Kim and Jung 2007)]